MAILRTLHAWAGAALSLLLGVLGLTGTLLTFKADWIRLTVPAARARVSETPQVLGAAAEALERMHPGHIQRIEFAGPDLGVHQVFFHGAYGYAAADGGLVAEWTGVGRPETWIYELHHFLLAGDTGMRIVGAAGLVAALLAVTGFIVSTPVIRNFRLRLWPATTARRDLLAAHRNIGALFALPVLLFVLSGAGLIFFKTTQAGFARVFPSPPPEEQFYSPAYPGDIDWVKALTAAQAKFPKARLRMAIWPGQVGDPAIVRLKQPQEWTPYGDTEVLIDPSTSTAIGVRDGLAAPRAKRLYGGLYPLHTARVGGRLYDVLTAATGLALAGLGVLGLWSFAIKPRRRRAPT